MSVILKSLGVASANGKVAELFSRNRFGGAAVDMGFERGLRVDHVTGWTNDTVGQQRLHAAEQRVSPAAQEGPDEAMRRAQAACSAREASVVGDADMVDKQHMGGEKPVSSIGSLQCPTFCDLTMVMRNANGVSEVKYENLVERCVRCPEEKGMYEIQRNAGGLLFHEDLWDRRSRGLSFVKDMFLFRKRGSCCKLRSERVTEESSLCCCRKDEQTNIHVKSVVIVSRERNRLGEGDWFERSWRS